MSKVSKKVALPVVAVLAVAGGGSAYYFSQRQSSAPKPETSQTDIQKDSTDTSNTSTTGETPSQNIPVDSSGNPEANHTPKQFETPPKTSSPDSNSNQLSGVVNFKQVSQGALNIRVTIDQHISSGSCTLSLTNSSGKTVTRTADVIANPSSATCKGFTVPVSELSSGKWNIMVSITNSSQSGQIQDSVSI